MVTLTEKSLQLIPFNQPSLTDAEIKEIYQSTNISTGFSGSALSHLCEKKLANLIGCKKVFLTNSCTNALEMSALLADIQPGDEIIMPSFTFPSTANAFVLRGGIPVFIDIRTDTLNLDEKLIATAISPKTKAIVPVHYGGVSCQMGDIIQHANKQNIFVIEDAAQAILSSYQNSAVGSLADMSAFSFHHTKNLTTGVGGCLCVNNKALIAQAEIIYQRGTNRNAFIRNEVDRYTWVDMGSAYAASEFTASLLLSQLKHSHAMTTARLAAWNRYHDAFQPLERKGLLRRPHIPIDCKHNAHTYYLILNSKKIRDQFIQLMKKQNIEVSFHFIPLHDSPAGKKYGRSIGAMKNTLEISDQIVRLPLWNTIEPYLDRIIATATKILQSTQ